MSRKSARKKSVSSIPLLLVGADSAEVDRKAALLHAHGYAVTRAESICHAEVFAAEQYFEAAVYDGSLDLQEQISLARIMRVRWPWMRLVRCGPMPAHADPGLFDAWSLSEERLPQDVESTLVLYGVRSLRS
jgi:hypothetical protein